ncbi:MAG TPA: dihydrolipoyl dehydrogenase [Gemmatimonadaceae bacterium]|nr:dihydrolipoyl dehydrogenase [Gemmatimonadaceae bacterium]
MTTTNSTTADVVVIGGGPGGYVAAIRAAQLGLTTVCVEMDRTLGGTCVNVGCIPSKALLESSHHFEFMSHDAKAHGIASGEVTIDVATMLKRKDDVVGQNTKGIEFLFRKNKITWAKGMGRLLPREGELWPVEVTEGAAAGGGPPPESKVSRIMAKHVIIATGSVPVELPFLKYDEERILSNVGALTIPKVPSHLIVIGGGVIGLELGSVWRRLGARVTVVELLPNILPGMDADVVKEMERVLKKQGLDIRTGTKVTGGGRTDAGVFVEVEKDGAKERLEGDHVLVSVGRKPALKGIDAQALGLAVGKRGEILVDDQLRTNLPNVFAIGDCVPGPMLAHKAEDEGVIAAEVIAGKKVHMHYSTIPGIVYTWPEVATVGLTEQQVKESGRAYKVGKFPFSANGRARTAGETSGFVKFVADATTDEVLGCHMVGPQVSELIAEIVLAMEYKASSEDIAITVHGHPTLSETTKEAALGVLGRAIHI